MWLELFWRQSWRNREVARRAWVCPERSPDVRFLFGLGKQRGRTDFCDFGAEFAALTPIREAGQREAGSVKSAKNAGNLGFSRKFTDTVLTMLTKMCRNMDFWWPMFGIKARYAYAWCALTSVFFIIITHAKVRFWPSAVMLYGRGIFDWCR